MADVINFTPMNAATATMELSIANSTKTAVALSGLDGYAGGEVLITNTSTTLYLVVGFGATAAAAQAAAVIPGDGSACAGIPIPPGWQIALTLPASAAAFVSAIASGAGPTIMFITQGRAA